MKNKLINMYLDYYNNFLSVEGFANYYGLDNAQRVINIGRELYNRSIK